MSNTLEHVQKTNKDLKELYLKFGLEAELLSSEKGVSTYRLDLGSRGILFLGHEYTESTTESERVDLENKVLAGFMANENFQDHLRAYKS